MAEHWLIRLHMAVRTGSGTISVLDGMNSAWSGSNWRFTALGLLVLLAFGIGCGICGGLVGRFVVVHL